MSIITVSTDENISEHGTNMTYDIDNADVPEFIHNLLTVGNVRLIHIVVSRKDVDVGN